MRDTEWVPASAPRAGDRVVLHDHTAFAGWTGTYGADEGYLMGLLVGDGVLKGDRAVLSVWDPDLRRESNGGWIFSHGCGRHHGGGTEADAKFPRARRPPRLVRPDRRPQRDAAQLPALHGSPTRLGLTPGNKRITPDIERCSSDFTRAFLRGLFDADGSVQGTQAKGVSVRLAQCDLGNLEAVQRMLQRLGIVSTIYKYASSRGSEADA